MIRLSQYARQKGVTYRTAWNWYKSGKLKNCEISPTGCIFVNDGSVAKEKTVVYARVSASENRPNLETQAKRVADFCIAKGWQVNEIVKECGSGINDKRPKLLKLLKDKNVTRIVVEHKDRLTRFGFNYIKTLYGKEIVVINEADTNEEDLIQDFVAIITSYCARIYGKRRSRRRTEHLIKKLSCKE